MVAHMIWCQGVSKIVVHMIVWGSGGRKSMKCPVLTFITPRPIMTPSYCVSCFAMHVPKQVRKLKSKQHSNHCLKMIVIITILYYNSNSICDESSCNYNRLCLKQLV